MGLQRSSGLVGHWKFNEQSGIIANDSSRYKNTGTLIGPVWADKGIKCKDNYVNCGHNNSINNLTNYSISVWFKVNTLIWYESPPTLVSQSWFLGYKDNGLPWFYHNYDISPAYIALLNLIQTDTWYFQVVTLETGVPKMYLNTIEQSYGFFQNGAGNQSHNTSLDLKIGGSGGSPNFDGIIGDVCIWNRVLNTAEIKQYYDSTKHKYI